MKLIQTKSTRPIMNKILWFEHIKKKKSQEAIEQVRVNKKLVIMSVGNASRCWKVGSEVEDLQKLDQPKIKDQ